MPYKVLLTDDAVRDLEELYDYIFEHDSHDSDDYVLDKIEKAFISLSELPDRGSYPKELTELGIHDYREIHFKPYRIIYRRIGKSVYVYLITDGRRDMYTLLNQRLLAQD
ncbi:MAG: type II toxin-antitoxin system RelE/ParE family toxin [Proteobacteria bacterium]|nr:type II toxin-antitoxin system RelE/ParE family toxin [Pseudomonadota bacterium]